MFLVVMLLATPAWAQGPGVSSLTLSGAAVGAGLVCIGAAFGIGKLAAAAYESMARQPEVAGRIFPALIIAAALIEGFTFYALYICSDSIGK
ncbi:MAG: ATP synthase F0 subunit C [Planctomycetes bacterium]|nr:ATP synthase F0 subunit C [Planctomycetota bacterium]